jgi:hypothetical protein
MSLSSYGRCPAGVGFQLDSSPDDSLQPGWALSRDTVSCLTPVVVLDQFDNVVGVESVDSSSFLLQALVMLEVPMGISVLVTVFMSDGKKSWLPYY